MYGGRGWKVDQKEGQGTFWKAEMFFIEAGSVYNRYFLTEVLTLKQDGNKG